MCARSLAGWLAAHTPAAVVLHPELQHAAICAAWTRQDQLLDRLLRTVYGGGGGSGAGGDGGGGGGGGREDGEEEGGRGGSDGEAGRDGSGGGFGAASAIAVDAAARRQSRLSRGTRRRDGFFARLPSSAAAAQDAGALSAPLLMLDRAGSGGDGSGSSTVTSASSAAGSGDEAPVPGGRSCRDDGGKDGMGGMDGGEQLLLPFSSGGSGFCDALAVQGPRRERLRRRGRSGLVAEDSGQLGRTGSGGVGSGGAGSGGSVGSGTGGGGGRGLGGLLQPLSPQRATLAMSRHNSAGGSFLRLPSFGRQQQ